MWIGNKYNQNSKVKYAEKMFSATPGSEFQPFPMNPFSEVNWVASADQLQSKAKLMLNQANTHGNAQVASRQMVSGSRVSNTPSTIYHRGFRAKQLKMTPKQPSYNSLYYSQIDEPYSNYEHRSRALPATSSVLIRK